MRGLLSLDQELRAVRRLKEQKNTTQPNHPPDQRETEHPWQSDIDQVYQTMREVLRAIASLSGVELPGLPPGLQDDGAPLPRLDIKNLKDRFRNDLEGFSIKITDELAKRARERTHAALDAIQDEVGGRIEQVAAELREQSQLPAQVEKLLEPSFQEAEARLGKSLSQKVEQLFSEQAQLVQERLQKVLSPVQAQTNTVEEAEARLERSLSQKVEHQFTEQEQLARHRLQEALSSVQVQIRTVEGAEARLERSLSQKVERLFSEQNQFVLGRLQEALISVQAQTNTVEEAEARLEKSLSQKVEQLFSEQNQFVLGRLQEALISVQAQTNTVEEAEARVEKSLSQKVERLFSEQNQFVLGRLQEALISVQAQISALEQTVEQIREPKADSVARLSAELPNTVAANVMKKHESSPNNELNAFVDQAFSRIEWSLYDFIGTPKIRPAQNNAAGRVEQHKTIPFNDTDMQTRVEQALEYLGRLGSKNPHPASKV